MSEIGAVRPPKHPVVCNTHSGYGLRPNRRRATWLSIVAGFPVPVKTNFGIGIKIAESIRRGPSRAGETSLHRAICAQSAPAWTLDSAPQRPRRTSANVRNGWESGRRTSSKSHHASPVGFVLKLRNTVCIKSPFEDDAALVSPAPCYRREECGLPEVDE